MDWDDLAGRITGPEGGPRYFRMGLVLVVLGIVAMAAIGFTPIFWSDESSLTYDSMAENPDDAPFGVPNSHALGHARWALAGGVLTVLMGLVMILEGKRVINLRRMLSWHAEARATALFSLAAMLSSIAMFAGASLVGLGLSMPTSLEMEGAVHWDPATSPAGIIVVTIMGLATVGMLGMAYYNAVLSVYRGGGVLENRRMARFAMVLAFLSMVGIVVLRLGTIMSVVIEVAIDVRDSFDVEFYYTISRISYQATLGEGEAAKGVLDWQLTIASALLFLSYLAAMAGLIGGSARSLGGNSLRVRRAAALPTTAILMAVVSLLLLAWASATAPTAVRDSWGIDDMSVSLGWGLLVGVVLSIGALAAALAYMRGLGLDFVREALSFWKKQEVSEEDLEEEGIPQPMLDQALAEEARARGELPPPEPEVKVPTPPLRERLLLKDARRNQIIIFVVLIVLIILLAVLWPRGGGDGNGNGDPEDVRIEELPLFHSSTTYGHYLSEEEGGFDLRAFDIMERGPTILYFIDRVDVTVTWTDESPPNLLWTNTPDEFDVSISDALGLDNPEDGGENPQGGQGSLEAIWSTGGPWVALGSSDLVNWGDQDVIVMFDLVSVDILVNLVRAGDQVTLAGRTQTDDGNAFTLTVTVSGHVYDQDTDGL